MFIRFVRYELMKFRQPTVLEGQSERLVPRQPPPLFDNERSVERACEAVDSSGGLALPKRPLGPRRSVIDKVKHMGLGYVEAGAPSFEYSP